MTRRRLVLWAARFTITVGLLATTLLTLAACGAKEARPDHWPARTAGTVLLDGTPLGSGTVTFLPEASEADGGRVGLARVDDGAFVVGNATPTKPGGLKPGRYRVTVLSVVPDAAGRLTQRIPEPYTDVDATPLVVEVVAGENSVPLVLTR